jgi:hypothetical protein
VLRILLLVQRKTNVGASRLRISCLLAFALLILVFPSINVSFAKVVDSFSIEPTENHHILRLNSDQPYVAGFQVNTDDLNTYGTVDGTSVTVTFLSTEVNFLTTDRWLGGGMFVQAQDTKYRNVDYGFYTMLVVDSSASLYVDIGLRQTREQTAPVQPGNEELVYAYTWHMSGINLNTPVALSAQWDGAGVVHYFVTVGESTIQIESIKVTEIANCQHIIPKFYGGNVINMPFPFSNYVNFFQFGVTSSNPIEDNHWKVLVEKPQVLENNEWINVREAWSIQGDIAFLDRDWKWGGQPYRGVNIQYLNHPLENPYQIIFEYTGETMPSGTVLWHQPESQTSGTNVVEQTPLMQIVDQDLVSYSLWGIAILLAFKFKNPESKIILSSKKKSREKANLRRVSE